jgi:hypothetical protein
VLTLGGGGVGACSLASGFVNQINSIPWQHLHQRATYLPYVARQLTTGKVDNAMLHIDRDGTLNFLPFQWALCAGNPAKQLLPCSSLARIRTLKYPADDTCIST